MATKFCWTWSALHATGIITLVMQDYFLFLWMLPTASYKFHLCSTHSLWKAPGTLSNTAKNTRSRYFYTSPVFSEWYTEQNWLGRTMCLLKPWTVFSATTYQRHAMYAVTNHCTLASLHKQPAHVLSACGKQVVLPSSTKVWASCSWWPPTKTEKSWLMSHFHPCDCHLYSSLVPLLWTQDCVAMSSACLAKDLMENTLTHNQQV